MVRILGFLAGLVMVTVAAWSFGWGAWTFITQPPEPNLVKQFHAEPRDLHLASDGPFGKYDVRQVQRGFQVYKEVCSNCHSLNFVAFRNLEELGYTPAEVKKLASEAKIPDIDPKSGDPTERPGIPADHFPAPFPNETAARASNGNALPPDLSLITKAREGGGAYVYSLLTGYRDPNTYRNEEGKPLPADLKPTANLHFNPWFANLNIAMPPPLRSDGQVSYEDGTKPTVDQMAQDVAAFLTWTAEPRLANRHRAGLASLIFLIFATALAYMAYQNIWHGGASRRVRETGPLDPGNMAKREAASDEAGVVG
ncbi:MAG: ubiquinol-cytochrome c reductase cytochrome c1 subunit [Sphingomonadales bacterium]|jgi:ubiquinol-cytochrome c reductase cytochrome c1 subunit|nr:ubiquinol-cytochrome c reductase cytochrome c1 subunit [Sphingomonadales bacterium]MEA3048257.1 ubiquinol-cytochrome c reductase cytochrome c1 subunit [Sphingomonadales bacterium]